MSSGSKRLRWKDGKNLQKLRALEYLVFDVQRPKVILHTGEGDFIY